MGTETESHDHRDQPKTYLNVQLDADAYTLLAHLAPTPRAYGILLSELIRAEWQRRQQDLPTDIAQQESPLSASPAPLAPPAPPDLHKTILIVDDKEQIIEMLESVLESVGYIVESASNGLQALIALDETLPHLIMLDLMMPVMDGRTFIRELEHRGLRSYIPVLAVSGNWLAPNEIAQLGADDFLQKPYNLGTLLEKVDVLIGPPLIPSSDELALE